MESFKIMNSGYLGILFALGIALIICGYRRGLRTWDYVLLVVMPLFAYEAFRDLGRGWTGTEIQDLQFWLDPAPAVALVLLISSFIPEDRQSTGQRWIIATGMFLAALSVFSLLYALRGAA
jgi:hypothetical protein